MSPVAASDRDSLGLSHAEGPYTIVSYAILVEYLLVLVVCCYWLLVEGLPCAWNLYRQGYDIPPEDEDARTGQDPSVKDRKVSEIPMENC